MKLINKKQLGEMLGVSQKTVYNLMQSKEIPFIRVGGSVRFDLNDIENYLNNKKK